MNLLSNLAAVAEMFLPLIRNGDCKEAEAEAAGRAALSRAFEHRGRALEAIRNDAIDICM